MLVHTLHIGTGHPSQTAHADPYPVPISPGARHAKTFQAPAYGGHTPWLYRLAAVHDPPQLGVGI